MTSSKETLHSLCHISIWYPRTQDMHAHKTISCRLEIKWELPPSQYYNYVRSHMCVTISQFNHRCILGTRAPSYMASRYCYLFEN